MLTKNIRINLFLIEKKSNFQGNNKKFIETGIIFLIDTFR